MVIKGAHNDPAQHLLFNWYEPLGYSRSIILEQPITNLKVKYNRYSVWWRPYSLPAEYLQHLSLDIKGSLQLLTYNGLKTVLVLLRYFAAANSSNPCYFEVLVHSLKMVAVTSRVVRLLPATLLITICILFFFATYDPDQGGKEIFLPQTTQAKEKDNTSDSWDDGIESTDDDLEDESQYGFGADFESDLAEYEKEMDLAFNPNGDDEDDGEVIEVDDDDDEDNIVEDSDNADGDVVPSFTRLNNSQLYLNDDATDWSKFAYVQYVTDEDYLCNSVMAFETLHRLGSRADRVMMYPSAMLVPDAEYSDTKAGQLLIKARDKYKVKLQPVEIQRREGDDCKYEHNNDFRQYL